MKSKKGFTLIELLAIIVILAIIAVITVPIILNIIEDSQKGAAKDSAYGFKDSVNKFYVSQLAKDPHFHLEDGTYTVSEVNGSAVLTGTDTYTISLSGTVPASGTIVIENNDIKSGNVQIGDYCIDLSNMDITKGSCGDTPIVQATPEECFEVSNFGGKASIIDYLCGIDSETPILDVVIPNEFDIEGEKLSIERITMGFTNKGLTSVVIPEGVTLIGTAFENNELTSITLPESLTSISLSAFSNNKLTSVTIPNNVTSIEWGAFQNNELTNIIIPSNVTTIGQSAFANNQLSIIEIPASVTSIGEKAFQNNNIDNIIINNYTGLSIDRGAFDSNPLRNLPNETRNEINRINAYALTLTPVAGPVDWPD